MRHCDSLTTPLLPSRVVDQRVPLAIKPSLVGYVRRNSQYGLNDGYGTRRSAIVAAWTRPLTGRHHWAVDGYPMVVRPIH